MSFWRFLEKHTVADIAIKVESDKFEDLLEGIVNAFFEISTSKKAKNSKSYLKRKLEINGKNSKEIVIALVEEIIFLKDTEGLVFPKGEFSKINTGYKAVLFGGPIDKYGQGVDIKALSYHKLEVKKTDRGWKAVLVFDV